MRIKIVVLVLSDGGTKIDSIRAAEMFDASEPVYQELLAAAAGEQAGTLQRSGFPSPGRTSYVHAAS